MPDKKFFHYVALLWLSCLLVYEIIYIIYSTKFRFRFWWYRRQGREDEVEAIISDFVGKWGKRTMAKLSCDVEISGTEHLPAEGPVIIMTNHQSLYDIPLYLSYFGRVMGFVAKQELFRIPGWGYWMKEIRCVSIDRADARSTMQIYQTLGEDLKRNGRGFIVFPEGTRTRDPGGTIGPFRPGALRLATMHGIPILPVSIDGTRFLSKGGPLCRTWRGGRMVRVKIAPLIHPQARSSLERQKLLEQVRGTIVSNFESIKLEWPYRPVEQAAD
ncbi:MAG: lysophospholipid acyltransferase family protein [SAR324 cluster bacterium]|nr:lysophospholipid acyltransferase family protein [SAR324 cluster bacterium]MCZ6558310.1 lysophospholipid acyltransferase family protein [SAR324 cluster bacterium]MCZ6627878.1 lysophospholipid acyltransferase family protein [SAR324 cluster bacterium]MCZ6647262.1 lysophospholipid acyltransferase family protein [SAR324 cluster bacterium]